METPDKTFAVTVWDHMGGLGAGKMGERRARPPAIQIIRSPRDQAHGQEILAWVPEAGLEGGRPGLCEDHR